MTDRVAVATALIVGVVLAVPGVLLQARADSDGLFYMVNAARLQGTGHAMAVREVFGGTYAREAARIYDEPVGQVRIRDPRWVAYTERFFQRRWLVPAIAAGLSSLVGVPLQDALQYVSMLGYALLGIVAFLLLRRRFGTWPSLAGAVSCLLLPPMYRWSFGPYVDSWGVLLELLGLLALVLVCDRGPRWLGLWIVTMLALSVTRDATIVLMLAAATLLVVQRRDRVARRRNLWLVATGALAAVPAFVLGGAPLRDSLAYVLAGSRVPQDSSWSFVLSGYPAQAWYTAKTELLYPADSVGVAAPVAYAGLTVVAVLILWVALRPPGGDAFWLMLKGAFAGCVLLLLAANTPQGFRYELVFVPLLAAGVALAWERWARTVARQRRATA